MPSFEMRSEVPAAAAAVFAWHTRRGALHRLLPPWENVRIIDREGGIAEGARTVLRLRRGPLPIRWVALHRALESGHGFVAEQEKGPFAEWRHTHRFTPLDEQSSLIEDQIEYSLPLHPVSQPLAGRLIQRELERTFRFRHRRIANDLSRHRAYAGEALRIGITGASGLIGTHLAAFLSAGGHSVYPLVRSEPRAANEEIYWKPSRGEIDGDALDDLDAIVHLAGRSIAAWRWTSRIRREIRESRVASTRELAEALAGLARPPRTLITASAEGYYGDRGHQRLDEDSGPGDDFMSRVCQDWEAAADAARQAGIRVVNLRFGKVMSAAGGMLAAMLPVFRAGLGGRLGEGWQYMSWIALDDLLAAILHALRDERLRDAVNATAPAPVTNRQFTHVLGGVLGRPTLLSLSSRLIRTTLGRMGEELLLHSARVEPRRLEAAGFRFLFHDLEEALRFELGRSLS